jgi:exodeoxyribonuclease V alpha subunit
MIVLTPMNKGAVGTLKLNFDLQKFLNHNQGPTLSYSGTIFKIDDRVMQIKNNYDKKVFNGDIGIITHIDAEQKITTVTFDTITTTYTFEELDEITLSYAITIHKSQGSEYDAVIIPLFMQHFTLLQRNLIYTAITRAKKVCFFIGQPKAIAIGIKNNNTTQRISFLQQFLTEDISCR